SVPRLYQRRIFPCCVDPWLFVYSHLLATDRRCLQNSFQCEQVLRRNVSGLQRCRQEVLLLPYASPLLIGSLLWRCLLSCSLALFFLLLKLLDGVSGDQLLFCVAGDNLNMDVILTCKE